MDLSQARFAPGKIILPQTGTTNVIEVPVDADNNFQLADFIGDKLPPGVAPKAKAFTDERVWHMGIVLAAQELKLDLDHADVDLPRGRITLRGANGVERILPVDANGYFYIDWRLTPNDPRLLRAPIESLLWQDKLRLSGETNDLRDDFRGKLVVFGFVIAGQQPDRPRRHAAGQATRCWPASSLERRQFHHHRPVHPPRFAAHGDSRSSFCSAR